MYCLPTFITLYGFKRCGRCNTEWGGKETPNCIKALEELRNKNLLACEIPDFDQEGRLDRFRTLTAFWKRVEDRKEITTEEMMKQDAMGPAKDYAINQRLKYVHD